MISFSIYTKQNGVGVIIQEIDFAFYKHDFTIKYLSPEKLYRLDLYVSPIGIYKSQHTKALHEFQPTAHWPEMKFSLVLILYFIQQLLSPITESSYAVKRNHLNIN